MSPPHNILCYKCNIADGTVESDKTGYALCDECALYEQSSVLNKVKITVNKGKINSGMIPTLRFNDAADAKIMLRELCQQSSIDTIVKYGQTNAICHMFYRHSNNKCYSFYIIENVTSPLNVYEITEDFIQSL